MLKNKLAKAVSLMLAVFMVATVIQMPVASAAGMEMSVTDTTKNHPFFDLEGDITTSDTNSAYNGNWYSLNSDLSQAGETGYMVFSFDGSESAVINGVKTSIKGTPKKLEFALLTYNWDKYDGKMKYEMSADKVNWYIIKENGGTSGYITYANADNALKAKYSDLNSLGCVTGSGADRNYYTITLPETFTDGNGNTVEPKYVRIGAENVKGYCRTFAKPTITWVASAGTFSVQNSAAVYPTVNDLKLDFNGADISALTKEDLTIADASGAAAEIAEISVTGSTASVTFAEALKPYTDYTVTVSESAVELAAYAQSFKTAPAFEEKTFKDTTMDDKSWFIATQFEKKEGTDGKAYYNVGYNYSGRFTAEGTKKTPGGELINGTISGVEFVLGYYASTYNISSGKVVAKDDNDTTIAELKFEDYVSAGAPDIAFASGMSRSYIKIPDGVLPRETVSVILNIGHNNQNVGVSQPGITWRDFGLNAEVAKLNGKVIPLDTVELAYNADIDESTVAASKFELDDGTNTVNPSAVTVKGNKVVLTFAEALEPETAYTLTCNKGCYDDGRPYKTIKTTEGLNTSPDVISFVTDVQYEEKAFTDTKASYGWLKLNNVNVSKADDAAYGGWYGTSPNVGGSVTFAFDNSGTKMIGDTIYRPDGVIKEIKFALGHFNSTTGKSFGISISSDGVNYTRIGTVADFVKADDAALYNDVTFAATYVQKKYVSIDMSALNPDTKYVKIDMPANSAALCKPSVKYLVPVVDYRMMPAYINEVGAPLKALEAGEIAVTCNVEGPKSNENYVLIMAAYKEGVLADVKVSGSDEAKHQATFTITDPQTEYIKTFLLNNLNVMMPLTQPISFGPVR